MYILQHCTSSDSASPAAGQDKRYRETWLVLEVFDSVSEDNWDLMSSRGTIRLVRPSILELQL